MAQAAFTSPASREASFEVDTGKVRRDMLVRNIGKAGMLIQPVFAYFFLWAPILILIFFSFNNSRSLSRFDGFTLQWYNNIFSGIAGTEARFSTALMLDAFRNSILVGLIATAISTTIG
ncbi:hypothetical protein FBR02_10175, partial [Anaerolineae bacterium CFX9]|nr:hypothetical protein [Anaerolineae bacterium CFX9]